MKSNKGKGLLGLLGLLVVLGIFGFFGYDTLQKSKLVTDENGVTSQNGGIKLGLDLAGGVSITYQAKEENPSAEDMSDTQYKLQQRVQNYSSEAEVYQEGGNRINVDIPGVTDANKILEELGKPGSLQFYDENWNVVLEGTDVASAKAVIYKDQQTGNNNYEVALTFTDEGTKKFADVTAANVGKKIAIVYDNVMYSNPTVQQAITGGQASISGMTSYEEAENLASTIRIGSLSLELEELRSNVVGAKLGQEAITTSLKAGAIGFGIVCVFMIVVYLIPGLAASLALCLYVALMLILLAAFEVTLTLPGIAGIILSIGMAVDANVIIFTRIKEELAKGKSVQTSIKLGFDKALSAIVDGNITTLIAAFVLYLKGSGTIKGFATTLAIGIILSMFTALVITKLLLQAMYVLGIDDVKYFGVEGARKRIPFVANRMKFFVISGVLILACVVMLVVNKTGRIGYILNYGLDFLGGTTYNVTFDSGEKIDDDLKKQVESIFSKTSGSNDVIISDVAGSNTLSVKTVELSDDQRAELTNQLVDKFKVQEKNIQYDSISAAVSDEMKTNAIVSVIIAAICMLIYIWFRFKDVIFASSAVLALLHDCAIVLLVYAASKISVGNTFIACMLTIVGYSINGTIIIFDRIREQLKTANSKTNITELVNSSITSTMSRTVYTSITTLIMLIVLFIMGVTSVKEFTLPLIVGIVVGAYSSVCLTSAMWYVMGGKKRGVVEENNKKAASKKEVFEDGSQV